LRHAAPLKNAGSKSNLGRFAILNEGRNPMPLVQVRVIKDAFSKEQKRQIISKS
jgi:hypothetical protein